MANIVHSYHRCLVSLRPSPHVHGYFWKPVFKSWNNLCPDECLGIVALSVHSRTTGGRLSFPITAYMLQVSGGDLRYFSKCWASSSCYRILFWRGLQQVTWPDLEACSRRINIQTRMLCFLRRMPFLLKCFGSGESRDSNEAMCRLCCKKIMPSIPLFGRDNKTVKNTVSSYFCPPLPWLYFSVFFSLNIDTKPVASIPSNVQTQILHNIVTQWCYTPTTPN